jgi:ribonucleoside-diphosphate reductase alpha chain
MQLTTSARTVLEARYLQKNEQLEVCETPEEMLRRVALAVSGGDTVMAEAYFELMDSLSFLPNSPTLMNAGSVLGQMSACFVLPIDDHIESIYTTLKDAANIHKTGGGTGFSFGRLRPRNDWVSGSQSVASGPVSFLKLYDASTSEIKQGGKRRGANMATLPDNHPDLLDFIQCKDAHNKNITNFNISVWASKEFMDRVQNDEDHDLINPRTGEVVATVRAREVFNLIVESAWTTGDPGLLFDEHMNGDNPTPWVGKYETTNPCGEQPLLPYEACVLGSMNLEKYYDPNSLVQWERLERDVRTACAFLDDCVENQKYVLPQIEDMHKNGNRKLGLGVMGWANLLSKIGYAYGDPDSLELAKRVMFTIRRAAVEWSENRALEVGPFNNYVPGSAWYKPRRNATLTTIAPTGTISIIAGTSSGIEPHFALAVRRENVLETGTVLYDVNPVLLEVLDAEYEQKDAIRQHVIEHGVLPEWATTLRQRFLTAHEIPYTDQLKMQEAFQLHTDNAVSKTINLPHDSTLDDVRNAYMTAYKLGLKGITVYRDGSKTDAVTGKSVQVLHTGKAQQEVLELENPQPSDLPHPRPTVCYGFTEKVETGLGPLYVTVNRNGSAEPFEVFANIGHAGSEVSAFTEAIGRLISVALQHEAHPELVASQLMGIGGGRTAGFGPSKVHSVPDAIGQVLYRSRGALPEDPMKAGTTTVVIDRRVDLCPQCHQASLAHEEGCAKCYSCGYSEC